MYVQFDASIFDYLNYLTDIMTSEFLKFMRMKCLPFCVSATRMTASLIIMRPSYGQCDLLFY